MRESQQETAKKHPSCNIFHKSDIIHIVEKFKIEILFDNYKQYNHLKIWTLYDKKNPVY